MERFADFMLASLALGIVAAWKGPRWWIGAVALAFISFLLGTSSFKLESPFLARKVALSSRFD